MASGWYPATSPPSLLPASVDTPGFRRQEVDQRTAATLYPVAAHSLYVRAWVPPEGSVRYSVFEPACFQI